MIDICVYAHRPHPDYFSTFLRSVHETVTSPHRVIALVTPGNCHENLGRAIDQCTTDIAVVCDEDVEFLTPNWLDLILEDFKAHPDAALINTAQVKNPGAKFDYELGRLAFAGEPIIEALWAPAHVYAIDMQKVGWLRPDVKTPGKKGMSDVDYCLQVRKAGYKILVDKRIVVYHPDKEADPESRKALANPTLAEEHVVYPQQVLFMWKKWGETYKELCPPSFNEEWLPRIRKAFEEDGTQCPW